MDVNKVFLIGRVVEVPEIRQRQSGAAMASFPLVTHRETRAADGERTEITTYHNVVVFDSRSREIAGLAGRHLKPGSRVLVEGRLENRTWEDRNGQERKTTQIVAQDLQFLDRNEGDQ